MKSAKKILFYKPVIIGLVFLFVALIMSLIGLHSSVVEYTHSDSLGPGNYTLGDSSFENSYLGYNRTLILSSNNASVVVIENDVPTQDINVTSTVTLNLRGRPSIEVFYGELNYTYKAKAISYPYSNLAIPGFIFMIAGTSLIIAGYVSLNSRRD
ncbi:hypothetical protein [Thermococcus gorgonarius]|uniref:Uncharacterized protein n=1 Tax=Thermococcus gorgonarius TaxID=71997 RepID=A0A2Z2M7R4_THEGO|nr:hypothetical protein [Thermococcus gorgonarius]ASJ01349.1 hypothetical protein A3K92_07570 [Thermococcus gorgonarius]